MRNSKLSIIYTLGIVILLLLFLPLVANSQRLGLGSSLYNYRATAGAITNSPAPSSPAWLSDGNAVQYYDFADSINYFENKFGVQAAFNLAINDTFVFAPTFVRDTTISIDGMANYLLTGEELVGHFNTGDTLCMRVTVEDVVKGPSFSSWVSGGNVYDDLNSTPPRKFHETINIYSAQQFYYFFVHDNDGYPLEIRGNDAAMHLTAELMNGHSLMMESNLDSNKYPQIVGNTLVSNNDPAFIHEVREVPLSVYCVMKVGDTAQAAIEWPYIFEAGFNNSSFSCYQDGGQMKWNFYNNAVDWYFGVIDEKMHVFSMAISADSIRAGVDGSYQSTGVGLSDLFRGFKIGGGTIACDERYSAFIIRKSFDSQAKMEEIRMELMSKYFPPPDYDTIVMYVDVPVEGTTVSYNIYDINYAKQFSFEERSSIANITYSDLTAYTNNVTYPASAESYKDSITIIYKSIDSVDVLPRFQISPSIVTGFRFSNIKHFEGFQDLGTLADTINISNTLFKTFGVNQTSALVVVADNCDSLTIADFSSSSAIKYLSMENCTKFATGFNCNWASSCDTLSVAGCNLSYVVLTQMLASMPISSGTSKCKFMPQLSVPSWEANECAYLTSISWTEIGVPCE